MTWLLVHWWIVAAPAFVLWSLLVARVAFRIGVGVVRGAPREQRTRIADVAPKAEEREKIPDLFKSHGDRMREALSRRQRERAGKLPWNYSRRGITKAEREALLFQLEEGQLDPAIEQILREELQGETK